MARDDVNWSQIIDPAPTGFQPRRRATSMFNVRTPTVVPEAFFQSPHVPQPSSYRLQPPPDPRQPPQQAVYGGMRPIHAPVPVEDLSSWSAKIQSQPPPELKLAAAK
ncbi:hypothetical protein C0993_003523, partial [Termitomyces sp. T159_Od127]